MPIGNFAVADVVMAIVIVVSAVFGLMRGLVREVLSLAIWAAALLLGIVFADSVAAMLGLDLSAGLQTAIGFAIVFVAVLVAGALAQRFFGGLVESTGLTGTDRTLGLVFGTVRGAAVVLVALILLRPFAESRDWWAESLIAPPLLTFENEVIELFDLMMDAIADPLEGSPEGLGTAAATESSHGTTPQPVDSHGPVGATLAVARIRDARAFDATAGAGRDKPVPYGAVFACTSMAEPRAGGELVAYREERTCVV